ncbi:MFS transporter [Pseudonocardia sp. TRM90224]|uniref:MFS transporter n=1 Tax=Pseudonocardia sp. TRM90224 TaxID=2812678 RepID=UPI001E2E7099|nr:MFS transporter [Pseudonocardia sp. TRM90224]
MGAAPAAEAPTSGMAAYRTILRLPGVTPLVIVSMVGRLPASGAAITLTLHVVLTLDLGYAAAGLVGAASTVGMAIGAPLLGKVIDKRGLRTIAVLSGVSATAYWTVAPWLPYPVLLAAALVAGVLGLPLFSVVRQSLAAIVPVERRRPAFAIDAMSVELSYIVGPALFTVIALQVSSSVAMWLVGAGWVTASVALWFLNPPTRAPEQEPSASTGRVREWLDLRLVAALLCTMAAVLMIHGTELSMIAGLQTTGQAATIAIVNAVWCVASLTGGFLYGAAHRSAPLFGLAALLGVVTLPVALGGAWWSYALLLIPAGLLIAPSLAASSETVSKLAPENARGVVTGLHASAITIGAATSTPLAGLLIDIASPSAAILTVGCAGITVVGVAALLARLGRRAPHVDRTSTGSPPVVG